MKFWFSQAVAQAVPSCMRPAAWQLRQPTASLPEIVQRALLSCTSSAYFSAMPPPGSCRPNIWTNCHGERPMSAGRHVPAQAR